ncbi:hypothetical protein Zm00014a_041281 [Zea mays]|uniref:Uncharacterized protein n=1 Tax=Zea mays TaxID=4577 RepID=A0A3L6DDL6_MAIZE|nr:hypothetical protein Zm00014a_041281 [Zea mays]
MKIYSLVRPRTVGLRACLFGILMCSDYIIQYILNYLGSVYFPSRLYKLNYGERLRG